jgi:hypothetical protein
MLKYVFITFLAKDDYTDNNNILGRLKRIKVKNIDFSKM